MALLAQALQSYGCACFVAHEDIEPNADWEEEIKRALSSMMFFVALQTDGFYQSVWTNQEVGYALGRGILSLTVKFGKGAPQGFSAKLQALSCTWKESAPRIIQYCVDKDISSMRNALIKQLNGYDSCPKLPVLSMILSIDQLNEEQQKVLTAIHNDNYCLKRLENDEDMKKLASLANRKREKVGLGHNGHGEWELKEN